MFLNFKAIFEVIMMQNKTLYQQFSEQEKELPLFLKYQWFNTLYNDKDWDVAIVEKGGEVVAVLPYVVSKKKSFKLISPQFLSPYQGVWMKYPKGQKYASKISYEKEVINELIEQLPKVDSFKQNFLPGFTNWMPFYWKGFNQTTRYTYILQDISNTKDVFANFKENIRREIRKAEKALTIKSFDNIEIMHQMKMDYHQNNIDEYPVTLKRLSMIYDFCKENNCGELLIAEDKDKNIHSLLLYVWDNECAYYLNGVTNLLYKTSGSMSLLLWEAIQKSSAKTKAFNFEGSMLEPVERYFRAFGGEQTPYFEISKVNSKVLKLIKY
jgi:lipid II:glycine glycyltransferase (peptidoglycan interpeptide bridge formation enzyme)